MGLDPSRLLSGLSPRAFRRAMRFFPPIRNTGVRVDRISPDWRAWRLRLPLDRRTRNYVGTHFGGTLYSAADPHLMLAWMHILPEATVWDKAASIRFRKPGRGTLRMAFEIPEAQVEEVRERLASGPKLDLHYTLHWTDDAGDVVAEVQKTVHLSLRR